MFQVQDQGDGKEKKGALKLVVTSGDDVPLCGACMYFFRLSNEKDLTDKIIDKVSYY